MRRAAACSAVLLLALGFTVVSREPGMDPRLLNASRSRERSGWIQALRCNELRHLKVSDMESDRVNTQVPLIASPNACDPVQG
jgi:hypothetical protein